jgi:hypothetical protein
VSGENDILRKEHSVLIERILSLNVDSKSNAKTKYLQAIDHLKAFVKVLNIQKLYKDFFEGHISNLNERVTTAFGSNEDAPSEKDINNFIDEEEFNVIEVKGTVKLDTNKKNDKKVEAKPSRLFNKIFEERGKSSNSKVSSERSNNSSASKHSKYSKISSKYLHLK